MSTEKLLKVKSLHVNAAGEEILHGIDMEIDRGEVHVLMGPNGAGKSTLGGALIGNPRYDITEGEILYKGSDVIGVPTDQRARSGMFLSFQTPLEVPGITVSAFIRSALEQRQGKRMRLGEYKRELKRVMNLLQIDPSYAERDLNVGFSGGEKKKAEILQLLMLQPALAILDETDSGLDVDAVRTVSRGIEEFQKSRESSLLIITHSTKILESLTVDHTHVLAGGRLIASGDGSLVSEINETGFEKYIRLASEQS